MKNLVLPKTLRRKRSRGRSGTLLVGAGETLLSLGLLTDTLGRRIRLASVVATVLEFGLVVLAAAVSVGFLKLVVRKLTRALGIGLLGAVSFGIGLPALGLALPTLAVGNRVLRRLPLSRVPWFGRSRWERFLAFVGGPRGLATGGVGASLLGIGAYTGRLGEPHVVFGHSLTLFALFVLLSVPGVLIYWLRRA